FSQQRPMGLPKRVIIIDEAQRISGAAQQLILKPLEEPPDTTRFLLGTTDPGKISGALKRRPATYALRGLGITESEKFITRMAARAGFKGSLSTLFEEIHRAGITSPGVILPALEKFMTGSSAMESVLGGESSVECLRICKGVTSGAWRDVQTEMLNATPD